MVKSGESLLTIATLIWLFSGVSLPMSDHAVPVCESYLTVKKLTNITTFLIVPPLVSLQVRWFSE
jgi:hypothetical protein